MKTALITGITGQDGSYLAQFLLSKSYQVVGMVSDKNDIGKDNIKDFEDKLILEAGDLLDYNSLKKIILKYKPNEIYNLAGISFIPTSWEKPVLTHDVNALGPLRILDIIAKNNLKSRFLQASSATMFAQEDQEKLNEKSPFAPSNPYGVSKLDAHMSVQLFRQKGFFASNVILFNHESEKRGEQFVTRKITQAAAKIKLGLQYKLGLGNLDSKADWGYAPDYVMGMWQILQHKEADDFILATGQVNSVRKVCEIAFSYLDLDYKDYIYKDEQFWRPASKKNYYGDPTKAETVLGWKRSVSFEKMIQTMVDYDLSLLKNKK